PPGESQQPARQPTPRVGGGVARRTAGAPADPAAREAHMIPGAQPANRAPLAPGDETWCLLVRVAGRRSRSGARHTVRGAALVRVEPVEGDLVHVVVTCGSGGLPGERLAYAR